MRNCQICFIPRHTWRYQMEERTRTLLYIYRNCNLRWIELSGWKGSVTYGLGADISLPPCPTSFGRKVSETRLTKATHGPKSRGRSFGTTLWHQVQRYCCLVVSFAHAQFPSNSSTYHIRGNEINCLRSSDQVNTSSRAGLLNMRADQSFSWLIWTSILKSSIF